jgi:hypothetical protein
MSDLNLQLVREYFELNQFQVLTHWPQESGTPGRIETGPLLFAEHINPDMREDREFVLHPDEVQHLHRVVIDVRAWHADRFYPSVVENNPVLGNVARRDSRLLAQTIFGNPEFTTLLVISELPASPEPRIRAVECLRDLGLGHVLEFPTMLQHMLSLVSPQGSYAPSQTLQTLRLLKRYHFIRRQQLEFSFPTALPRPTPLVETQVVEEADED